MGRGWRKVVLGVFGLGTLGAVLLASGMWTPEPKPATAVSGLPPAVAPPAVPGQNALPVAAQQGNMPQTPEERLATLEKDVRENPNDAAKWGELAELHGQKRRFAQAADAFWSALQLEPANVTYRGGYATALFFQGMTRMALQEYRKAVEQEPENAGAHMNLAIALSHGAPPNIGAAKVEWEEVVRLAPGEPIATKAQEYLDGYKK